MKKNIFHIICATIIFGASIHASKKQETKTTKEKAGKLEPALELAARTSGIVQARTQIILPLARIIGDYAALPALESINTQTKFTYPLDYTNPRSYLDDDTHINLSDPRVQLYRAVSSYSDNTPAIITSVEKLIKDGASVNFISKDDYNTPLSRAITHIRPALVSLLIKAGADVNAKDLFGYTPLITAIRILQYDGKRRLPDVIPIIHMLLENGADPYIKCNKIYTVELQNAFEYLQSMISQSRLKPTSWDENLSQEENIRIYSNRHLSWPNFLQALTEEQETQVRSLLENAESLKKVTTKKLTKQEWDLFKDTELTTRITEEQRIIRQQLADAIKSGNQTRALELLTQLNLILSRLLFIPL